MTDNTVISRINLLTQNIPDEIKTGRGWCTFQLSGPLKKHPLGANLQEMNWTNCGNRLSYTTALSTYETNTSCDGIGVFLGNGLWGIDIDHCVDDQGYLSDEALDIVKLLSSYVEYSPSGHGLHILAKSDEIKGNRRSRQKLNGGQEIEIYDDARYFTITGNVLPGYKDIRFVGDKISEVYKRYFKNEGIKHTAQTQNAPSPTLTVGCNAQATNTIPTQADDAVKPDNDDDLLAWMFDEVPQTRSLWEGDISSCDDDHSRADMTLANYLVNYCHGDVTWAESLFNQSELAKRDKWTKRADYRLMTMSEAFSTYESDKRPGYFRFQKWKENQQATRETEFTPPQSLAKWGPAYWSAAVDDMRVNSNLQTGWKNLDKQIHSLYPALYVLGAPPGKGKTTWAWQLCEQLAISGHKCVYVTLEQTAFELMSKSIARRAYLLSGNNDSPSATEIRRGVTTKYTQQALDDFQREAAPNLYIIEGHFGTKAELLTRYLTQVVKHLTTTDEEGHKVRPTVVLDYIQPLGTVDTRKDGNDTMRTKAVVECVKDFQRDNRCVLIVITAYSRDAYRGQTQLDSARDSSGIEYTADIVMGLDSTVYHRPLPDKKPDRDKMIKRAEKKYPREITLNVKKSRYYDQLTNAFRYHSKHDCFMEYGLATAVSEMLG